MSSRKEQKEQARLAREEAEREHAAQAARSRRLTIIGGVIGLAVIAVLVAVVISLGGDSDGKDPLDNATATEVNERFQGIPQSGITLGEPNAPATIVEFADLKCPFCAEFARDALPTLIDEVVRTGKAKIIFRNLTFLDAQTEAPDSTNAAKYAGAVGLQNKMWNFVDLFYLGQDNFAETETYATEDYLKGIAGQIPGVNPTEAWDNQDDPKIAKQLEEADTLFNEEGLDGTPSFLVGPSDGELSQVTLNDLSDPQPLIDEVEANQE